MKNIDTAVYAITLALTGNASKRKRAQLMLLTDGCMSQSCSGSIDLRYLR